MQQPIKKLLNGGLDADSAEFLVPPNCFISGYDVRIGGTTDKGGVGYIENILENAEKFHVLNSGGENIRIGFAADDENGWIAKFNWSSTGNHGIFLFDIVSETWYTLLMNGDVTGGLNFEKNQLIHSTRIENGILYWCNGTLNEPRKINIRAAVNMNHGSPGVFPDVEAYTSPISQNVLYWIRRQPGLPPTQEKMTSSPVLNNFTKEEGFWFYYRYIYRDYEISTLSALSELANYNTASELYNFLAIEIPFAETIEQDVLQIDLVVKYANSGKSFVIKSWNRNVPADLSAIEDHNDFITALNFDYYNDFTGIALDDAYSVKPYDSLPIYAQTIEIARNRAFMLNYTLGYDTPIETSLTAEFITETEGADAVAYVVRVFFDPVFGGTIPKTRYVLRIPSLSTTTYFCVLPGTSSTFPDPTDYLTLTEVAPTGLQSFFSITGTYNIYVSDTGDTVSLTNSPSPISLAGNGCFKTDASYQLAVEFLDFAGRKCGALTSNYQIYKTPDRDYSTITYTTLLNWTLSNTNALDEIPEWAHYYSILITKCLRTRQFLQLKAKNITYVTKDADGAYVFNEDTYAATQNGIGIDITSLDSFGMGYVFSGGDLVKVYKGSDVYRLSIIAQEGNWIVCELQDIGVIGDTATPYLTSLFEIYTPYRFSLNEPFYEIGSIYQVLLPGTDSREYSVTGGSITGDVTLLDRGGYLTENMSPNDKFYTRWNTNAGRPNFIDTIGQEAKTNEIAYSDVLIQGTKTNGLSTFEALNTKDIPIECGDGTKLQVADKITEQGNIMLAICVNETVSLYLGEAQLLGTSQNAFIAQSADVIGTVNVLQGSYGSMNAESVVAVRGRVFFYCLIKGCFVGYSNAGLFPISDYGMKRVSHLFSQAYASLSQDEIEALGSRPFVFGGVDPYHMEVYWSIPATTETPPKGYLEDYISPDLPVIYPYDIYDGRAKVLVFKPNQDRWAAPHNYQTEGFIDARDYLFSAKNGSMYKHNNDNGTDDTYSKWYGEVVKPSIGFIINEEPNIVKQFLTLNIEGNTIEPTWVHHRTELPFVQSTDNTEWNNRRGVLYEKYGILRDRLSPNATGTFDEKLYTGDKMAGQWMKVYVEYTTNELLQIRFFTVGVVMEAGQKT